MRKHSDRRIIYAALIGNSAIAVMKFIVAAISGSAAILAEGFHSTADSGNQMMLLVDHSRAKNLRTTTTPSDMEKSSIFGPLLFRFPSFLSAGAKKNS